MSDIKILSSSKDIIKNKKIDLFECYEIGNRIIVTLGINSYTSFNNGETLVEFPFFSKIFSRVSIHIPSTIIYITKGSNSLKIQTPNVAKTEYYIVWNLEFYI